MSMGWMYGPHHWLWMIVWVGFWALVVAGLVMIIRAFLIERRLSVEKKAMDYLNERYAKGEISRDEYLQKREDILKGA
jgi:putative membrane protein